MDEHLQKILKRIKQELKHIHYRWKLYRQMFGTNPYRIELINKTSSNVFIEFQWLVIDYIVMALSKLTDPARTRRDENLSFNYLIEKVRESGKEELANVLQGDLNELVNACTKFKKIRNKRVAHNDLVTALEEEGSPLPGVNRFEIEKALEHARNIMNEVEHYFYNSKTFYQEIILPLKNDGRSVLIWLQKGLAYEQMEKNGFINRGKWRELGDLDS